MQYKVYCLFKSKKENSKERVIRVKVIADGINEALLKAKEKFMQKLEESSFNIFMYETV